MVDFELNWLHGWLRRREGQVGKQGSNKEGRDKLRQGGEKGTGGVPDTVVVRASTI